ncbi:unnamed protein product [Arabis nemorensis]|uniref:F-box domain-containing protein n=1 Tax=Arabis nemorensis TaxID=586526 RepID=A0A565C8D7_9BRAS|nr:unnamed protein product [Arabis nemorensis]
MSSSSVNEPPHDKEEKVVSISPLCPLSSLPYEVALSCLARLSRSDHVALSLVSKRYHSLVLSLEFYNIRSLMGRTEKYLYECLRTHYDSIPRWYILRREKPNSRLIPYLCSPLIVSNFHPSWF